MRKIYIIDSSKKCRNFSLQVASTLFQVTYLKKILLFIYCVLWRKQQLFLVVILSFCLVLVSRINIVKNIANHCSAISFLAATECFSGFIWLMQIYQER